MSLANEVVHIKMVKVLSITDDGVSQENVGKVFFDLTEEESDLSTKDNFYYLKDLDSSLYLDILRTKVVVQEIGYVDVSRIVLNNYIYTGFLDYFKFVAENTKNELYVFGRVSEIHNFRFLQLTENMAMAYTSLHSQDKGAKSTGSYADIYHFVKIGEVVGKSIYIYHSDMVIKDRDNSTSLEWVGSFENFKGEEIPTTRVISKLK